MYNYFELVGHEVEVMASGILYRGRLVEMGEENLHMESSYGWITIPMERVTSVTPAGGEKQ